MFNFSYIHAMKPAKHKDEMFKSNPLLPVLKNAPLNFTASSPVLKCVYTKPCDNLNEAENYAEKIENKGYRTMLHIYEPTIGAAHSVYEVKVFEEQAHKK